MCHSPDPTIAKLAILSELAVLKDIIPAYRIVAEEESAQTAPLSKDVQQVRDFELSLLKAYQRYLRTLEEFVKSSFSICTRPSEDSPAFRGS